MGQTQRAEGHGGPIVTREWVTGKEAVNAFEASCLKQGWIFTSVPQENDFGKDGYVDIVIDGEVTGYCIAVQIKGGRSFKLSEGYKITSTDRQRELWKYSTVPVFGIVHDPEQKAVFWTNITEQLWQGDPRTIRVSETEELPDTSRRFMESAFHASVGSQISVALGSDDEQLQMNALWDIAALGRGDHRQLILLRRVMFGLQPSALDLAITILNECTLNLDLLKTSESVETGSKVRPSFVWTVDEAVALLDRVDADENGYFGPTSIGNCVYWLLVASDIQLKEREGLVNQAAHRAASESRQTAAGMGLILLTYWAQERGAEVLESFLQEHPQMRATEVAVGLAENLSEYGQIEI